MQEVRRLGPDSGGLRVGTLAARYNFIQAALPRLQDGSSRREGDIRVQVGFARDSFSESDRLGYLNAEDYNHDPGGPGPGLIWAVQWACGRGPAELGPARGSWKCSSLYVAGLIDYRLSENKPHQRQRGNK